MNWQELDGPTRAACIAAAIAVVGLLVPPLSVASAVVAIVCSGVGWRRSRKCGRNNAVAKAVLLSCTGLILLIVIGSALLAAGAVTG